MAQVFQETRIFGEEKQVFEKNWSWVKMFFYQLGLEYFFITVRKVASLFKEVFCFFMIAF